MTYEQWIHSLRLECLSGHVTVSDTGNFEVKILSLGKPEISFAFFANEWEESVEIFARNHTKLLTMSHFKNPTESQHIVQYFYGKNDALFIIQFHSRPQTHRLSTHGVIIGDESYRYSYKKIHRLPPVSLLVDLRKRELTRPWVRLKAITGSNLFEIKH